MNLVIVRSCLIGDCLLQLAVNRRSDQGPLIFASIPFWCSPDRQLPSTNHGQPVKLPPQLVNRQRSLFLRYGVVIKV